MADDSQSSLDLSLDLMTRLLGMKDLVPLPLSQVLNLPSLNLKLPRLRLSEEDKLLLQLLLTLLNLKVSTQDPLVLDVLNRTLQLNPRTSKLQLLHLGTSALESIPSS